MKNDKHETYIACKNCKTRLQPLRRRKRDTGEFGYGGDNNFCSKHCGYLYGNRLAGTQPEIVTIDHTDQEVAQEMQGAML